MIRRCASRLVSAGCFRSMLRESPHPVSITQQTPNKMHTHNTHIYIRMLSLYTYCVLCTVCFVLCTAYCVLRLVYCVYSVLCIPHSPLRVVHYVCNVCITCYASCTMRVHIDVHPQTVSLSEACQSLQRSDFCPELFCLRPVVRTAEAALALFSF